MRMHLTVTKFLLGKEEEKYVLTPSDSQPESVEAKNPYEYAISQGWGELPPQFDPKDLVLYTLLRDKQEISASISAGKPVYVYKISTQN